MEAVKFALDLLPGSILRFRRTQRTGDPFAPRVVDRETQLLVEGFPRSANTFCYYYLQLAFPEARIAHHVHSWQQFLLARFRGIPSVLVVREPDASVASLIAKYPGRSVALAYVQYALLNGLSTPLAGRVVSFRQVTDMEFLAELARRIGGEIGQAPRPVTSDQIKALMKTRTEHKNRATTPIDLSQVSAAVSLARRLAFRVYRRMDDAGHTATRRA